MVLRMEKSIQIHFGFGKKFWGIVYHNSKDIVEPLLNFVYHQSKRVAQPFVKWSQIEKSYKNEKCKKSMVNFRPFNQI